MGFADPLFPFAFFASSSSPPVLILLPPGTMLLWFSMLSPLSTARMISRNAKDSLIAGSVAHIVEGYGKDKASKQRRLPRVEEVYFD